jgi:hypothetical protein
MRQARWLIALALTATFPRLGAAQDPRLERRLDSATFAALTPVLDSAQASDLPLEPLVQRALEGAAKHAGATRIVAAVRLLATELGDARAALGTGSTSAELVAGASALRAGAHSSDLAQFRRRRGAGVTVPLAAVTDLVTSGVPPDSAVAAVLALVALARDDQIVDFRRAVERDIALGAPPAAAAAVRVNAAVREFSQNTPGNQPRRP